MRFTRDNTQRFPTTSLIVVGTLVWVFIASNAFAWSSAAYGDAIHDNAYEVSHASDWRFIADDNGVVTDAETNLEWFVGPDRDTTWDEAKSWVESLSVDGSEWRMPTKGELRHLYSRSGGVQNMSPLFKTTGWYVWANQTVGSTHAWGFSFDIGGEFWPRRTFSDGARGFAVRSARCENL